MTNANLLLHPVRMRILQTLVGSEPLTTAQLRDRLPDIAPATMYRHIATLTKAEVLEVVSEKRVRGTVERSYQVRQERVLVGEEARKTMTREDHQQAFTTFSAAVMSDFDRYLADDEADPPADNVVYRQGAVWLTDDDFASLVDEIEAAVAARADSTPGEGRTRHIFSYVIVPDAASGKGPGRESGKSGKESDSDGGGDGSSDGDEG
ncbi:helix-turn-helix domain-containing protein [Streptomyces sp. NBC_01186]|uniref:helix-turn-helix domain-containing protein n=1 Tax=Streptomyces sp. NBC_01186 TaxID=2903765 RepID=UPI002E0DD41B|nr:helix-turn-helix domain-containing protein [Streptomyces sp. NBC_01186]